VWKIRNTLSHKSTTFLNSKVFFRADGSNIKGLGHIVRCLSVIEMIKEQFNCLMIVNNTEEQVFQYISQTCQVIDIRVHSAQQENEALMNLLTQNDILVLDGYDFNEVYQQSVKKLVKKLVAIDDLADKKFEADVIFNHGDIKALPPYKIPLNAKVLSGFDYLIARPEFLNAVKKKRNVTVVDTVFICMGGADPFNITVKVLEAAIQCAFIKKIIVVTGSLYKNKNTLQHLISLSNEMYIEHIENASAAQIVNCIQQSQLAVSTASSVSLEICCVKAALLCGTVIDNQKCIHSLLVQNECCTSIGNWIHASVDEIKNKLEAMNDILLVNKIMGMQQHSIDGRSGERILQIFNELAA